MNPWIQCSSWRSIQVVYFWNPVSSQMRLCLKLFGANFTVKRQERMFFIWWVVNSPQSFFFRYHQQKVFEKQTLYLYWLEVGVACVRGGCLTWCKHFLMVWFWCKCGQLHAKVNNQYTVAAKRTALCIGFAVFVFWSLEQRHSSGAVLFLPLAAQTCHVLGRKKALFWKCPH